MAEKTIMLESAELGVREFELSHAQSLIQLEARKGKVHWKPVKGSRYTIEDGSLIEKKNIRPVEGTEERKPDTESEGSGS